MNEPRAVPAPAYGSAIRLKRAKTSLSDIEIFDSDLRARGPAPSIGALPKQDVVARKRSRRGFSLNKLTTSLGLQKSTRQRIDKASISRPIVDCQSVVPVSPSSLELGHISPTSHTSHFLHANTSPTRGHSQGFATYPKQLSATDTCRFDHNDITQKFGKMDASRLSLQPPATGTKLRQRQAAQEMQNLVIERARRSGEDPPPYDFFELIGRGSFGRVFKGTDRKTGETVAIKILDIDSSDYIERSQDQLSSTLKEISILQQLRDSKARPYVNVIMEALPVHNELWIISEYASGGSVSTLMKPNANKGLDEKFIIPIARELAWALKYTHEIGILHRDLKCANILILEDGRVQLCDFGVSGIVEARQAEPSKRFSVHGTPHWLAPELIPPLINNEFETELPYGPEVDIWAYACTVYEMATGRPPNATTAAINLPNAPLPTLEGGPYSQDLKDFVDFLFVRDPENRPTIDQILEHPYLVNSTKMYPTVMLVKLLEDYTQWERAGGSRISLIDPKAGAPAPDPLAPDDDDDDDWTFSTSEDFETRLSRAFPEQFGMPDQNQDGMAYDSGQGQDRFANLMEIWKQERIARGKEGLERLFNPNADPYRWDNSNGRPPSDLVLRDYHPGAPNRETVIDLDFAAPVAADGRSIDLGDVSHIKANRRYLRDSHLENENSDIFDMDAMMKRATQEWKFPSSEDQDLTVKRATQDWKFPLNEEIAKRATKDWKFPMTEESLKRATREMKLPVNEEALKRATKDWKFPMTEEALKRATQDWKFPPMPEQPNRQTKDFQFPPPAKNRATREWTFSAAIAEANYNQRNSRRETRDWKLSTAAPAEQPINRKTRDFVFPMSETVEDEANDGQHIQSSPTLESNFRPTLRHAATEPASSFDDYPRVDSTPNSPLRSSMIDLDMAVVDDYRPPSAGSASTTIRTAMSEQLHDNPFNLEDQVHLSENNNRTSYHTKSQSEPNHAIPGLLTPQTYDEQGQPTNPESHHQNMHARGVSSVSQMQAQLKPPNTNNAITQHRPYQRSQAQIWDGWSHSAAYNTGSDESPPASVVTDMSVDDEDIDEAWDALEKQTIFRNRYQIPGATHHQTTASRGGGGVDDDVHYADADYDDPARLIRVSLGPNGKPLVEFPIPRGPDPEALLGINGIGDGNAKLEDALWKSAAEIRDGVRACRDLMKAMRLVEGADDDETSHLTNGNGTDISATVRLSRADR